MLVLDRSTRRADALGVNRQTSPQIGQLVRQLLDKPMKHLLQLVAVLDAELQEAAEGVVGGRRAHAPQRVKAAELAQLGVAPQLADQRGGRGVLKHDTRDQRIPHRAHRVVVPAAAPALLEKTDQRLVGQRRENPSEPMQVTCRIDVLPAEQRWLWYGRHVVSVGGGVRYATL